MTQRWQGPGYQVLEEIPPGILPLTVGGATFGLGVAGWAEPLAFLRYIDVPFTLLLFGLTAYLALGSMGRGGNRALIGTVLALLGTLSALLALLFTRGHPLLD